jgi:alcohol dehydrogenase
MNNFNYYIPTRIFFGPGSIKELGTAKLPGKKALIVISAGPSMKKYGYLQKVQELLTNNNTESVVFDKILPNPVKSHVMEGAELARKEKCDFILGLGGGSSIDSAKSIALMVKNPGDYWDYIHGGGGLGKGFKEPVLPVVAITTTAGTGTEADPWTVITNEELHEKIGFGGDDFFPVMSIVDPEMMLSIPPGLTAYQGFDAFFHAAEGYIANIATPVSDIYALKSIALLAEFLPVAVKNGKDLEARTKIALANTLSGMVESTSSCTSEHSMEHALSAFHPSLPHGAGLIMLSESYFKYFAEVCPKRLMEMSKAMGEAGKKPADFITALIKLQKNCGVADLKMSDYGIEKNEINKIAENAHHTMGGLYDMDRKTLSLEETIKIITAAYK